MIRTLIPFRGARLPWGRSGALHAQGHGPGRYVGVTDEEALRAFRTLSEVEGIIAPGIVPAVHAGMERAKDMGEDQIVVITVSGRGDKDLETVIGLLEGES